jgi:hypothetical protein
MKKIVKVANYRSGRRSGTIVSKLLGEDDGVKPLLVDELLAPIM